MVLEASFSYLTVLIITLFFTCFSFFVKESFWKVSLKIAASLFWFVLAIGQFIFFGIDDSMMILALPYVIFGMLFIFSIIKDALDTKRNQMFNFDD